MKSFAKILMAGSIVCLAACATGPYVPPEQKSIQRIQQTQATFDSSIKLALEKPSKEEKCKGLELAEMSADTLEIIMSQKYNVTTNPARYSDIERIIAQRVLDVATPAAAEARLELGDVARKNDCKTLAEKSYDAVLKVFQGLAYDSYRDRAQGGLNKL